MNAMVSLGTNITGNKQVMRPAARLNPVDMQIYSDVEVVGHVVETPAFESMSLDDYLASVTSTVVKLDSLWSNIYINRLSVAPSAVTCRYVPYIDFLEDYDSAEIEDLHMMNSRKYLSK